MKKGFTMIELIFVIVILGILASVAIPRLAATREDAEISATVANLRTLVSDVTAYYTAKGEFGTTKWKDITNVPLQKNGNNGGAIDNTVNATTEAFLYVGGKNCIGVKFVDKDTSGPARIEFTTTGDNGTPVCKQVRAAAPVKAYLESTLTGVQKKAIAIGSSTSVYTK
ncbi:MAG: type II secretion system protein [Campylobacter sp.]|uniref:type II secretion system protein n=1 Tax=Campylobacter sp. TaxID=205 RepID=UPI002A91A3F5|nr:type II secretion system protein [Campylobacter sp.]MCI6178683.1 type II secretion system GspH family protein [Campylobacter sp.]MDY6187937.1 type II secretion system protein [Campylobacter sp.]